MSVSYFVRYDITAVDAQRFVDRYREVHLPLLAQLEFESVESMEAALQSEARAAAREDFRRFPPYEGSVVHQAMAQEEVFRAPWVDGNEEGA
jgi:hypothetical protein